ncbi:MAG: heme-degrading domain-containing protein [Betaproteobacteria bacterium]|jgi:uncharacterized protein (UPF0303 family)|nr:heme-degrading domain-containing protein [Betaproteobacteria bacterium]
METAPEQEQERMAEQQRLLVFPQFGHRTAWELGQRLKSAAEARNVAVSIEVRLGGHTVFSYTMPDASPANADWARRKCNTVELMHRSSYAVGRAAPRDGLTAIQRMGLDPRDYAEAGGGFPIAVAGSGCIGAVAVSGLPQREDHALVVEVLAELTGVPIEQVRLP